MTAIVAPCVYRLVGDRSEAPVRSWAGLAVAVTLALPVGGCGISYPLTSLVPDTETTSSTKPKVVSPLSAELGEEDWRRARGALTIALDPQGNGSSVAWDNPDSLMKGNFAPVGQPFVKTDEICRAFLAGVTGQSGTTSLQGTACRPSGGEWVIKDVKPWRKPT